MTDQHPLTDDIGERIFQHTCSAEAERIIDQRCQPRFLYPRSHRPLMTHPLTDETCADIVKANCSSPESSYCEGMRVAADWQLEQCITWLDDTDCDDPQETAQRLREAMRPNNKQEDN